jgi:PRTRC genetic system ThiF family protein
MSFVFKPNLTLDVRRDTAKHFIIIGAGGNGAYLIRDFIRQVKIQNDRLAANRKTLHSVTIVDADDIEDKNLLRQNFIRSDVGKNKAEVMANRYGAAFGTEISYVSQYIESADHLLNIASSKDGYPVFMGAVDNNATRKLIWEAWKKTSGSFWIDAGNEEYGGQVVCGYNYRYRATAEHEERASHPQQFYVPCVVDIYPEIAEGQDKLPTELSCAERAVSAPQNIFTNLTAANLMMGFANNILTGNSDLGDGLKCHSVAFNTKNLMSFTTRFNHLDLLQTRYQASTSQPEAVQVPVGAPAKKRATKNGTPVPAGFGAAVDIERNDDALF